MNINFFLSNTGSSIDNGLSIDLISIVISIGALVVSIYAICTQKKGIVFKHRLEIYSKVNSIIQKCDSILKRCPGKREKEQKQGIASILFDSKSDELSIAYQYITNESILNIQEAKKENFHLENKYFEVYFSKYYGDSLCQECQIFYSKEICSHVQKLYSEYNKLLGTFLFKNKESLEQTYEEIKSILKEFQQNKILEKMKKKLPV